MKVRLLPPNAQDEFYLIKVKEFMGIVDELDLAQRESEEVVDAYHEHWLSECDDGIYAFHAPEFCLTNGMTEFINGRHRTVLLARHLNEIPMALTNMDGYPIYESQPLTSSIEVLKKISKRKLSGEEIFEFPDLPIKYLGYDHNIGK